MIYPFLGKPIQKIEAEIKPLLHLIMATLQVTYGDQEYLVWGVRIVHSRSGWVHGSEEV